jgi:hypothetical protein
VNTLGDLVANIPVERAHAVKLTIDSNEPLEDAIRVVGALYGVTLVVGRDEPDAPSAQPEGTATPAQPAESAGPVEPVDQIEPKRAGRRKSSKARRKPRPVPPATESSDETAQQDGGTPSAGVPSNADVRSWARTHGLTVNDRGRLPASVLSAYREAHDS